MTKFYTIFNQMLAGYLMFKGFVLMDISPNRDGTGHNVFHFVNSEALMSTIEEYKALKRG